MSTYALSQFTTFVRRVLALNLPEALWVKAELAQVNTSRGHVFLSLIEKSEETEEIIAQVDAVIWSSQLRKILSERGQQINQLLQSGLEVKLRVTADFHDRFGFKLIVEDIDLVHTLGKLAQQRQATLQKLKAAGLLDKQSALDFPLLPQRIAVISSQTAAGYADFRQQLLRNLHHFHYELELFSASMQGALAPKEIIRALHKIARRQAYFDLIVIIRGGGARMDLVAFDDAELCAAVANAPLPVLSGIGHETDEVLLDYVAYGSLKTPTAVASFLLDCSGALENKVLELGANIQRLGLQQTQVRNRQLDHFLGQLKLGQERVLTKQRTKLDQLATSLPLLGRQLLTLEDQKLQQKAAELKALDPKEILKRGYSLLSYEGKIIRSVADVPENESITATLSDGKISLGKT